MFTAFHAGERHSAKGNAIEINNNKEEQNETKKNARAKTDKKMKQTDVKEIFGGNDQNRTEQNIIGNKHRASPTGLLKHACDQRDHLHRLPEPHVVPKDASLPHTELVVEPEHLLQGSAVAKVLRSANGVTAIFHEMPSRRQKPRRTHALFRLTVWQTPPLTGKLFSPSWRVGLPFQKEFDTRMSYESRAQRR